MLFMQLKQMLERGKWDTLIKDTDIQVDNEATGRKVWEFEKT